MTTRTTVTPGVTGRALMRALLTGWITVLVCSLVGLGLGLAYAFLSSRAYSSSATVTINPITSTLFATGPLAQQVNTATEAEVMESGEVLTSAAAALGDGTTPSSLKNALTISSPPDSLVISVAVTADSADQSAAQANAIADSYLEFRRSQAEDQIKAFSAKVDARIKDLSKSNAPGVDTEIAELRRSQSEAVTLVVNPGTVIQRALPPTRPSWPRLLTVAAVGGVLGFLAGMGLVVWRMRRRDAVLDPEDISVALGGRDFLITETIRRPDTAGAGWLGQSSDDLLALYVALDRVADEGPLVILGPPELRGVGSGIAQSAMRTGASPRQVIDLCGKERGEASIPTASAGAVIVMAVLDRTRRSDIADSSGFALRVVPETIPMAAVLVDLGGSITTAVGPPVPATGNPPQGTPAAPR